MARPPPPLADLLADAVLIVEAEVIEVVSSASQPPEPPHERGASGVGRMAPAQVVRLRLRQVLRGSANVGDTLEVDKPEAAYALRVGNHGPFLLSADPARPTILGPYGPDSYPLAAIEAAL